MPPPKRKEKAEEKNPTLVFEIDGRKYVVHQDEVSGKLDLEVRRSGAVPFGAALNALGTDAMGIDCVATLIYIARRQAGEPVRQPGNRATKVGVDMDEILEGITYGAQFEVLDEEPDDPEAPAAD